MTTVTASPVGWIQRHRRVLVPLALILALVAASVAYVKFTSARETTKARENATESGLPELAAGSVAAGPVAGPAVPTATATGPSTATSPVSTTAGRPPILTVNRSPGSEYGIVARLGSDGSVTPYPELTCERIAVGSALGACLLPVPGEMDILGTVQASTELTFFDPETGAVTNSYTVAGRPSRLRMSADDRYAGYTAFVTGHSYAVASSLFSTNTVIVDSQSGVHRSLEAFQVIDQDGEPIVDPTRNYWGVTFSPIDSDTFYAALGIGEQNWIIEGSVSQQTGRVLAEGLMCPSASPDGKHLVARDRTRDGHYALYDLTTGTHRPLDEDRVVDDQVEWLDDHTVMYAVARDNSPANQPVYDLWTLDILTGERHELAVAANSPATLPAP